MTEAQVFCANHPSVATQLRCNRCGKAICSRCAVRTPVGYRCRECVKEQQKAFDTAATIDYPIAFVVSGVISFFAVWLLSFIGFWGILIAPAVGAGAAEIVRRATRSRRSRWLAAVAAGGGIAGALPVRDRRAGADAPLLRRAGGGPVGSLRPAVAVDLRVSAGDDPVLEDARHPALGARPESPPQAMLQTLRIKDFAIIAELELSLADGFVVFTGETGAGKSIIVDAVQLALGGRADATGVREGAETALVEAAFALRGEAGAAVAALLEPEGLLDDPASVVLAREIRREGRNLARINGRTVALSLQRQVGELLVDVHGQSEHLSLLRVQEHLHLLDRFAGDDKARTDFAAEVQALVRVRQELDLLRQGERDAARRSDFLAFTVKEIEAARLRPGEKASLVEERTRLANAERLAELTSEALGALDEAGDPRPGAADRLAAAVEAVDGLARVDPSLAEVERRVAGGGGTTGGGRPEAAPLSRRTGGQPPAPDPGGRQVGADPRP